MNHEDARGGDRVMGSEDNETAEQISARFGRSIEWAREHLHFPHRCISGHIYRYSCLVTDPDCDRAAKEGLRINEGRHEYGVYGSDFQIKQRRFDSYEEARAVAQSGDTVVRRSYVDSSGRWGAWESVARDVACRQMRLFGEAA